ncbi:MAG: UMP kinase [bacterium]|nr:UMP kinase [bacterium]
MSTKKKILLKLTGSVFLDKDKKQPSTATIISLITQIKQLNTSHQFGIVVGGGNFFRGNQHGKLFGLTPTTGHNVGMLATMMNGLILADLCEQHDLSTSLLCAINCSEIGKPISQEHIMGALKKSNTIIFAGGTGSPFFTTDTNAVLRALQMSADEIWKGTKTDGIYDADPFEKPQAQLLKTVSFDQALQQKLGIMDLAAYALAQQYNQTVRVFNIFSPNSLMHAAQDKNFGSTLQ